MGARSGSQSGSRAGKNARKATGKTGRTTGSRKGGRRRYRQQKRADQQEETRRRIVDALVELHESVGPARTTVTEVAERADVGRMTVYNHFPTERDMIGACSEHWATRNPPPDVNAWGHIRDPAERLRTALLEWYRYCRHNQAMLGKVLRDEPLVPALAEVMRRMWWPGIDAAVECLMLGRGLRGRRRERLRRALRLALDFRSWQILGALGDEEAATTAARMVEAAEPAAA